MAFSTSNLRLKMTQEKIDWVKKNSFNLATLIALITFSISLLSAYKADIKWRQKVDSDIIILQDHVNSEKVHMELLDKLDLFVTRVEFIEIKRQLDLMNARLNILLEHELKKKL